MTKLVFNNDNKKIISFTINKSIKDKINGRLLATEGYNLKMKSRWVNEAIGMFKKSQDYKNVARLAEGSNKDFVLDKIYMSPTQLQLFTEIRNEVVKAYPDVRGPQAAIIRASILNRLIINR